MSRSPSITTRGIVIARAAAGEGSVACEIYTEELGSIRAVAKSAREERSKLRAHLVVGTTGTFTLVEGARGWRVTGAVATVSTHFALAHDPAAQRAAARVFSLARTLVRGVGKEEAVFIALLTFTESLLAPRADITTAERRAVAEVLAALGYVPHEVLAGGERELVAAINRGLTASGLIQ